MTSPYRNLPPANFWKTGVAEQQPHTIADLYRKRFPITGEHRIATAGSCFAQHIATHLRARNFRLIDAEPPPEHLPADLAKTWGYNLYSARYGNIYLVRQLLQLVQEAFGQFVPTDAIWEKDGRYYDALRPSVEPNGLESPEAVALHRKWHLRHVRRMLRRADVFVFTLGLTEGWVHRASGTVYATAPETIAGTFDEAVVAFKNFGFDEILADFEAFRALVKAYNDGIKFLLTVSPVPLTATASDQHVLSATTYSKSVLRAVAGELYRRHADVDYFPSYELIASPFSRGAFYAPNLRSVTDAGVEAVMRVFFDAHGFDAQGESVPRAQRQAAARRRRQAALEQAALEQAESDEDLVCEEILLEAFGDANVPDR